MCGSFFCKKPVKWAFSGKNNDDCMVCRKLYLVKNKQNRYDVSNLIGAD